jgi:hypothetical protein
MGALEGGIVVRLAVDGVDVGALEGGLVGLDVGAMVGFGIRVSVVAVVAFPDFDAGAVTTGAADVGANDTGATSSVAASVVVVVVTIMSPQNTAQQLSSVSYKKVSPCSKNSTG